MTEFKFTDNSKNVLKTTEPEQKGKGAKRMGRPKAEVPRNNKITCYFSDDEYQEVKAFLDGRPGSSYLRQLIMERIRER